jgi:hypothetical protein
MKVVLASGLLLAATAAVFTEGTRMLLAEPPAVTTDAEAPAAAALAPPVPAAGGDVRVVYPAPWALTKLPRQPAADARPVGEAPDTSALRTALTQATGARIVRTIPVGPPPANPPPAPSVAAVAPPDPAHAAEAEPMVPADVQVLAKEFDGPPTPPVRPARVPESSLVDLNTASLAALDGLGAGKIGRAIIRGRPYDETEDLVTKRVLKRSTFDRIKSQIEVR